MRAIRFTAVFIIICLAMAGQGDAQKPARRGDSPPAELARLRQQQAVFNGLLETWEKCVAQLNSGTDALTWCDAYNEQMRQTPIDTFVSPQRASKLKAKLTPEDFEEIKRAITNAMGAGYNYGKEKGSAK